MRAVAILPKSILNRENDDQDIVDKLIHNVKGAIQIENDQTLNATLKAEYSSIKSSASQPDRYALFDEEYENARFNIGLEYAYFAVDYTVEIQGLLSCFADYTC